VASSLERLEFSQMSGMQVSLDDLFKNTRCLNSHLPGDVIFAAKTS